MLTGCSNVRWPVSRQFTKDKGCRLRSGTHEPLAPSESGGFEVSSNAFADLLPQSTHFKAEKWQKDAFSRNEDLPPFPDDPACYPANSGGQTAQLEGDEQQTFEVGSESMRLMQKNRKMERSEGEKIDSADLQRLPDGWQHGFVPSNANPMSYEQYSNIDQRALLELSSSFLDTPNQCEKSDGEETE